MYLQKARRTRKEKINAHRTISWIPNNTTDKLASAKTTKAKLGQEKIENTTTKDISKSLIVAAIIIFSQIFIYFYLERF
ncbi:MAG: hypothetical protein N2558_02995 [Patescibacteria group bacterium]|nr:hypothetical protein [Patescibacteria group bacterium]